MSAQPIPQIAAGADRAAPLRVAEVANRLERMLGEQTPQFWLEAELSKVQAYGSIYFCTLSDGAACLNARISATVGKRIPFQLTTGLSVLVFGRLSYRRDRSEIVFQVSAIEPRDVGAMQLAFEQLRAALAAEGLFAPERKRPVPRFATKVGVVTSRRGSVIHDIVTSFARRWPSIDLVLWPVSVQGSDAAAGIAAAIAGLNRAFPDRDVLLVGRGGGSAEDLAAFNTERVVRAIAASAIPVVSCVGHETDVTLADLAADVRASTPTMAAELVTPVTQDEVLAQLEELSHRAGHALRQRTVSLASRVRSLRLQPVLCDAERFARPARTRLDRAAEELPDAMGRLIEERRRAWRTNAAQLHAVSPLGVLERGFAVVRRPDDPHVIRAATELAPGETVRIRLHEGSVAAEVTTIDTEDR